jgi:hypothetical protein
MKTFQWPLRAFLFVGLLQFASCAKNIDAPSSTPTVGTSSNATLAFDFSRCKLRRIYQSHGEGYNNDNGLFTYDKRGNPVKVVFTPELATSHYFDYDKNGRLKQYRIYDNFDGYSQHVYAYGPDNRITQDTIKYGTEDFTVRLYVSTLTYDSQGRIVKENIRNIWNARNDQGQVVPLEPTRNPTYTYDNRGNLAVAGWKSSSYDNKVSIFRTHPIFQFIHRNYSVNNSSAQAKYNSKGLPLGVLPGNDKFFNLPNVNLAVYDCQ